MSEIDNVVPISRFRGGLYDGKAYISERDLKAFPAAKSFVRDRPETWRLDPMARCYICHSDKIPQPEGYMMLDIVSGYVLVDMDFEPPRPITRDFVELLVRIECERKRYNGWFGWDTGPVRESNVQAVLDLVWGKVGPKQAA